MRRSIRNLLVIIPFVLVLAAAGFFLWAAVLVPAPMAEAAAAIQSDSAVTFTQDANLVFRPANAEPTTGLIFYPGGRVVAQAYAPAMRAIAEQGYLAVIVPMPLNLAILGTERAKDVITAFPDIQHWVIAGHSLGGSMAARFAYDNPDLIDGVVLWASYPEASKDLSGLDIATASIYGTLDGLATRGVVEDTRSLLPPDTAWVAVEGGNHAQFGWYGDQSGDQPATISREEQQAQVIAATLDVLRKVES